MAADILTVRLLPNQWSLPMKESHLRQLQEATKATRYTWGHITSKTSHLLMQLMLSYMQICLPMFTRLCLHFSPKKHLPTCIYRVVQNYWYCEKKSGCGICSIDATPPKSYMNFFFDKNNISEHFTSRNFHKYWENL